MFASHQGWYGSPRVSIELRDQGLSCSRKRVARLMHEAELWAKCKQRRAVTTKRNASHPVAPHLLARDFTATEPNTNWVKDITYVPKAQGWLYFAVILDVYIRTVVGWSMSAACGEEVVENALRMALARRCPKAGQLHHSDRGCHYTSRAYRLLLEYSGMIVSMSRKGNCWDNAVMESFFGTLKEECVYRTIYPSYEQAKQSIFDYLEVYYNWKRRHTVL